MSQSIDQIMRLAPVIPVIVIDRVEDAVPMAEALVAGGLRVLEVTMRTPAALDAIRANVTALDARTRANVIAGSVMTLGPAKATYDLIMLDPPYGTGAAADWSNGHKFGDLTGSDKAGFEVRASDGTVLFRFHQDYVTSSSTNIDGYTAYSGYQSLGFSGGDGSLVSGGTLNAQAATLLKDFDSTLELNLNQAGIANNGIAYTSMTVNSPVGDAGGDVVNGYYFTSLPPPSRAGRPSVA